MSVRYWKIQWCCLLMLITVCVMAKGSVTPAPAPLPHKSLPIAIVPQDGFNLQIEEQLDPYNVIVKLTTPAHNWFGATLTNLPTNKEVTIGLSMQGNDGGNNIGDVSKWKDLHPVLTYADPTKYESYEWFVKDDNGVWVSGDPLKQGTVKYAGTRKTPIQTVIPATVADQFLSADGRYWSAWCEVNQAEALPNLNIFRVTQRFVLPTATVAMRVPFTYTYLQQFLAKLQAAKLAGVFVDELGLTPEKRKLQVIRIEDPALLLKPADHPTICIIAREHATEQASSWALHGALNALLSDSPQAEVLRHRRTWLFIPIEDPDGSSHATFDHITERFYRSKNPPTPMEVLVYARHLIDYIAAGQSIDAVVSFHNVEANECAHVFNPFRDMAFYEETLRFNRSFFARMQQEGYRTESPDQCWKTGAMTFRLFGWLADRFGTFDLCYEVNDRYPQQRLSLAQLHGIGRLLVEELGTWTESAAGQRHHQSINERLAKHRDARSQYLTNKTGGDGERSPHELLTLGF